MTTQTTPAGNIHPLIARIVAADAALDLDGFMGLLSPDVRMRIGSQPILEGATSIRAAIGGLFSMMREGIAHRLIGAWGGGNELVYQAEAAFHLKDGRDVALPYVNVLRLDGAGLVESYLIHIDLGPLHP